MGFRHVVTIAAALTLAAAASPQDPKPSKLILDAVADAGRPAEDKARDVNRKPAETVAFAGVKPGDTVVELLPGGGYYTRILAKAVGPKGHVYTVVTPGQAQRPGGLDRIKGIIAPYPNVELLVSDLAALTVPKPAKLVWTSENYHDMHNSPTMKAADINKSVFNILAPGGLYYVEDHSAPGTGITATSTLHRIDPQAVRDEVTAAGFKLEAETKLLANPADPHTTRSTDPAILGHTDKFAMRFRKPK